MRGSKLLDFQCLHLLGDHLCAHRWAAASQEAGFVHSRTWAKAHRLKAPAWARGGVGGVLQRPWGHDVLSNRADWCWGAGMGTNAGQTLWWPQPKTVLRQSQWTQTENSHKNNLTLTKENGLRERRKEARMKTCFPWCTEKWFRNIGEEIFTGVLD